MTVRSRVPRCLVLLASRNGAEFIGAQLESILAQREVEVEILVGDDASTDTTLDAIENLNAARNIRVNSRETGSGSAAQNFVRLFREADVSHAEYVALSDQDDIWLPDKLRRATGMLAASGASGYSCSVIARWPDGRESLLRQSSRLRTADFLFEGAGQGCTFVVTAALFTGVQRLFRERPDLTSQLIYHDWATYALARAQGFPWVFDAEPFILYRQHSGNDTGARSSVAGIWRRRRMLADGSYRNQVAAVARLCQLAAPRNGLLQQWMELDSSKPQLVQRLRKALFCFRNGRRKPSDRVATALFALAGWL